MSFGAHCRAMKREAAPFSEFSTIPEAARRLGIATKTLRRAAREGAFPTYSMGTAWPRVRVLEVQRWIVSTRIPPIEHARKRVAEALAMEAAMRANRRGTR